MAVEKENLMSISEVYHENTKDRRRLAPIMSNLPQQHGPWYKAFKRHPHKPQVRLEKPIADAGVGADAEADSCADAESDSCADADAGADGVEAARAVVSLADRVNTGDVGRAASTYPKSESCLAAIATPAGMTTSARAAFETILHARRSIRHFSSDPLTLDEINRLMYFSNGITAEMPLSGGGALPLRASPSAGALYPIEFYSVVFSAEGLQPGVYHYDPSGHTLEFLRPGDFRELCYEISHGQEMVRQSSVLIAMTAAFDRTKSKYGERGYRYVLLDAGHALQNLYLESTALGLGCCTIGGFLDDEANRRVGPRRTVGIGCLPGCGGATIC